MTENAIALREGGQRWAAPDALWYPDAWQTPGQVVAQILRSIAAEAGLLLIRKSQWGVFPRPVHAEGNYLNAVYSESLEMYLETIYDLSGEGNPVHSVDIAGKLEVSKPSVNRALGVLKKEGLINHEPYGSISFTPKGWEKAEEVRQRHDVISQFLSYTLNIPAELAEKDACRIEHVISKETLHAMKDLLSRKNLKT